MTLQDCLKILMTFSAYIKYEIKSNFHHWLCRGPQRVNISILLAHNVTFLGMWTVYVQNIKKMLHRK
jgi:hypothetical protein